MVVLCFRIQGEDILEHTNAKCHLHAPLLTCRSFYNTGIHLFNTIRNTHAKILVSALERLHITLLCPVTLLRM